MHEFIHRSPEDLVTGGLLAQDFQSTTPYGTGTRFLGGNSLDPSLIKMYPALHRLAVLKAQRLHRVGVVLQNVAVGVRGKIGKH
jgi:aspartyl aminopeptidase